MFEVIKYIGTPLALIAFIYAGYINSQTKKIKKYDNLINSEKTKEQIEAIQKILSPFTNEPLTVNDIKNDPSKMELAKENIKMKNKSNSQKFILSIIFACLFSFITVIGMLVSAYTNDRHISSLEERGELEKIQTTPEDIEEEFIDKIKEVDIGISDNFVKETLDMPPVVDKIVTIGLNDDNNEVINEEFRQQLYVAENCFLYTLSRNNSIEVYSVTLTEEDACFDMPEGITSMMDNPESKLGKLTLADISDIEPDDDEDIWMNQSSKFSEYFERQYFGFPGHYYDYIFGYTDLGYQFNDLEDENVFYHYSEFSDEGVEKRYNLRKEFKPNLFAVSGINLSSIADVSIFFYEGINFVWD